MYIIEHHILPFIHNDNVLVLENFWLFGFFGKGKKLLGTKTTSLMPSSLS
jgi:hypothetical protein